MFFEKADQRDTEFFIHIVREIKISQEIRVSCFSQMQITELNWYAGLIVARTCYWIIGSFECKLFILYIGILMLRYTHSVGNEYNAFWQYCEKYCGKNNGYISEMKFHDAKIWYFPQLIKLVQKMYKYVVFIFEYACIQKIMWFLYR